MVQLHSEREPVTDAPAVYFVRPTEDNLRRIADDCAKQLYRTCYVHLLTRIERPALEMFAQLLISTGSMGMVAKIFDEYLDTIALEPALFTLNIKNSFAAYNDPRNSELEIRSFMNRVSMGLLSLIRIMGSVPVIRSPVGGAAEMLARDLCALVHENISPRGAAYSLLSGSLINDRARPLMLIFDRTCDMASPVMHSSTYQSLIDDLLDHKLNRVTIESKADKKKTYDLNTQTDSFFGRYAGRRAHASSLACVVSRIAVGAPFPVAVEANEKELAEVAQKEADIRSRPGEGMTGDIDSRERELNSAIESLPDLLARKANLEAHTNILQAAMTQIAGREVPTFFELEQGILTSRAVSDKPAALTLLRDGSKGSLADKARLLVAIAALVSSEKPDDYDGAFVLGCQSMSPPPPQTQIDDALAAVKFVRRLLSLQSPLSQRVASSRGGPGNVNLSSFISSAHIGASSLMAKAASLFAKFTPVYVTRVVDSLSEGRPCAEDDSFCSLDPKAMDSVPEKGARFSEVIVFVLGGGSYSEYDNLQELLKQKLSSGGSLRTLAYGCSELVSGDVFLNQLVALGSPAS